MGKKDNEEYYEGDYSKRRKKTGRWIGIILAAIVVIVFVASTFTVVPTGYTGVKVTLGQVSDRTISPGLAIQIPFAQQIVLVNNKQQDVQINVQVWGESSEKTPVYAQDIYVTYRIAPEMSRWIYANVSDSKNLMDSSLVASAIKSAMVEVKTDEVTKRSVIEPMVKECLKAAVTEKYGSEVIEILKVTIDQMDFEESYNEAIAQKSIARQAYETQQIQNRTNQEKAEADKNVAITKAQADAETKKIAAEADAAAILTKANANAEANELLKKSLDDRIIRKEFIDKWNGELPKVSSEGSMMFDVSEILGSEEPQPEE